MNKYNIIFVISSLLCIIIINLLVPKREGMHKINDKNAIVALTRGYDDIEKYHTLISRNVSIYDVYYSKLENPNLMDVIIFHEGNITDEHQNYIRQATPNMPIIFTVVAFYNNTEINDKCPPTELSKGFPMGYKNMCYFWSIDFLDYLKDYEYIIRIDEDCIITALNSDIFKKYNEREIMFSCGSNNIAGSIDNENVIVGMRDLFYDFIVENNISPYKSFDEVQCPYTNVMIVNVNYFNNNKIVKSILEKIKKSNCIFSNRWGDLPIWGYILSLLIDSKYYFKDTDIQYYHGSHGQKVN